MISALIYACAYTSNEANLNAFSFMFMKHYVLILQYDSIKHKNWKDWSVGFCFHSMSLAPSIIVNRWNWWLHYVYCCLFPSTIQSLDTTIYFLVVLHTSCQVNLKPRNVGIQFKVINFYCSRWQFNKQELWLNLVVKY